MTGDETRSIDPALIQRFKNAFGVGPSGADDTGAPTAEFFGDRRAESAVHADDGDARAI